MIDYIQGIVEFVEADSVVVGTASGVGYRIFCPNPYEWRISDSIRIFTHHHVREDAALLYGFKDREQRNLFRKLLDVSGIGPKGALAIIASAAPVQIAAAIQREDLNFLTKFPGIGKKTAGRLVLDLKDKLRDFTLGQNVAVEMMDGDNLFSMDLVPPDHSSHTEAAEALKSLGYNDQEVIRVMKKLENENASTEHLIKQALHLFISN